MARTRAALGLAAVVAAVTVVLSGGSGTDPQTPRGLPGLPPPFLGVAVVGSGGRTAAVDAYGTIVDLRAPGPASKAVISVPSARQKAGTVPADAGIVARMRVDGQLIPLWKADSVRQSYVPQTNVLRTVARVGDTRALIVRSLGGPPAAEADRRWVRRARPLDSDAPGWAQRMYERSLLVLRALTDRRTGAVAAGARDSWAYVWPRDAGAVAIAFASAGYRAEARHVVHFLQSLDLEAAARFHGDRSPVAGRAAQGDAAGWVAAAARVAGLPVRSAALAWRDRADYQEGGAGDYLANAVASAAGQEGNAGRGLPAKQSASQEIHELFGTGSGVLIRRANDADSGIDSAAAWAVQPFSQPPLFPLVRRSLLRLAANSGRYGIVPSESWASGDDPWTAPTAWTAWGLAALGERRPALRLMAELRRASTPTGLLPERVDLHTGIATSTTPLAWSHAFAILTLRELWP